MSLRGRSAGTCVRRNQRFDPFHGVGCLLPVAEIPPKGLQIWGNEALPDREGIGGICVQVCQVDNDPEIRRVRAEGLQEIRLGLVPFSLSEGSDTAKIVGASGLRGGGPAIARLEKLLPIGVPPALDEGTGGIELPFTMIAEGMRCCGQEDDPGEKDPMDDRDAARMRGEIRFQPADGEYRAPHESPEEEKDQEPPSEQEDFLQHSRGDGEGAQGDGTVGKGPEGNLVRRLGDVEGVMHNDGEQSDEESSSPRDARHAKSKAKENRECRREEKGMAEKGSSSPSRELKRLSADIGGVCEENGEEGPEFQECGVRGRYRSFRLLRTRDHCGRKPDESVSENGNGVPPSWRNTTS